MSVFAKLVVTKILRTMAFNETKSLLYLLEKPGIQMAVCSIVLGFHL